MPDKALIKQNSELQGALAKLREEVALAHAIVQTAQLRSLSTIDLVSRMREGLEDIRRRTAPESVLSQLLLQHAAYDEIAELHITADSALRNAAKTSEDLAQS